MTAVIQRVQGASVTVEGVTAGEIEKGLLVLIGIKEGDGTAEVEKMAEKILKMRIFSDENGKMNRSVTDIGGEILTVSNFTLCASCRHGNRPDFFGAAKPEKAKELYECFINKISESGLKSECGIFGADMKINASLNGPVTIVLDSERDLPKT